MVAVYTKTEELKGMPDMDEVGKAVVALHDILADMEQLKRDKDTATARLVQALKRSQRKETKYKGKTYILQHLEEQDVIKVKK